jgi:hypothetical protein
MGLWPQSGSVMQWVCGATGQTVASLAGRRDTLHPVQDNGGDPIVRRSAYRAASGGFTVQARTVAVFVTRA